VIAADSIAGVLFLPVVLAFMCIVVILVRDEHD